MTKPPVELNDDGELAQPVDAGEKPKRKRGESPLRRTINLPIYILLLVFAPIIIIGLALWSVSSVGSNEVEVTAVVVGAQAAPPTCNLNPPPAGARIAYVSSADSSIHLRSLDTGADCILVTFLGDNATEIALSPDGERIAYTYHEGTTNDIWVINSNGLGAVNLTPTHDSYARYPAWSADGTRIAFTAITDNTPYIAVMNADGTDLVTLAQGAQPAWSPDGSRIAFVSSAGGSASITVMNADGTNIRRVTNSPTREAFPSWSPDSTRILFARTVEENQFRQIYTVAVDDPQMEHRFIAETEFIIYDLEWLTADRFAYTDMLLNLYFRLFPPNDGSRSDAVIFGGLLTFDWWAPAS